MFFTVHTAIQEILAINKCSPYLGIELKLQILIHANIFCGIMKLFVRNQKNAKLFIRKYVDLAKMHKFVCTNIYYFTVF